MIVLVDVLFFVLFIRCDVGGWDVDLGLCRLSTR